MARHNVLLFKARIVWTGLPTGPFDGAAHEARCLAYRQFGGVCRLIAPGHLLGSSPRRKPRPRFSVYKSIKQKFDAESGHWSAPCRGRRRATFLSGASHRGLGLKLVERCRRKERSAMTFQSPEISRRLLLGKPLRSLLRAQNNEDRDQPNRSAVTNANASSKASSQRRRSMPLGL